MTKLDNPKMTPAIVAALAIAAAAFVNIAYASGLGKTKVAVWLITLAMIALLCACIGKAIANRWDGVLVDGRNRVSLSRLQMLAWTLLVLSGLTTAAAGNLAIAGNTAALAIVIQDELLAVMGIAATSLAATPALLKLKESASPGAVATKSSTEKASWLDLFRGDEADDETKPDLSKIQQFLISLILIGAYCVALGNMFRGLADGVPFRAFPALDLKFVWLLGISHAGYLTYKAAPKPPTQMPPQRIALEDGSYAISGGANPSSTPAQAAELAQRMSAVPQVTGDPKDT